MAWEPLPGNRETTTPLADSLSRLNRTLGLARPDTLAVLADHWKSLLGTKLASRCELESLRGSELVIAVDDHAIAEHLRWSSSDLIGAVNAICGSQVVDSVSVRLRRRSGGD